MKIELNMTIPQAVRFHDALEAAERFAEEGEGKHLLGFAKRMVEQALKRVEQVYDDSLVMPTAQEVEMARAGRRIDAIKVLRERTGAGLKTCKDAIDRAVPFVPAVTCRYCGKSVGPDHAGCGPTATKSADLDTLYRAGVLR